MYSYALLKVKSFYNNLGIRTAIIHFTVCLYVIKKYFPGADLFACSFLVLRILVLRIFQAQIFLGQIYLLVPFWF